MTEENLNPTPPPTVPEAADKPALPDHLSTNPRSPHFVQAVFEHDVGIRFNGKERSDVEEYCISERWIKVAAGKLTGDAKLQADGKADKAAGKIQNAVGSVKDALRGK